MAQKRYLDPLMVKINCLLTELKSTSSSTVQELIGYGVPTGPTQKNSRWQTVSCAAYSFKKNNDLFNKVVRDKIVVENISEKKDGFRKKTVKESERFL